MMMIDVNNIDQVIVKGHHSSCGLARRWMCCKLTINSFQSGQFLPDFTINSFPGSTYFQLMGNVPFCSDDLRTAEQPIKKFKLAKLESGAINQCDPWWSILRHYGPEKPLGTCKTRPHPQSPPLDLPTSPRTFPSLRALARTFCGSSPRFQNAASASTVSGEWCRSDDANKPLPSFHILEPLVLVRVHSVTWPKLSPNMENHMDPVR